MLFIAKCLNNIGKTYKYFTHTELLFSSSNGKVFNIHVTFIFMKAIFKKSKKKQEQKYSKKHSNLIKYNRTMFCLNLKILKTKTIEFFYFKESAHGSQDCFRLLFCPCLPFECWMWVTSELLNSWTIQYKNVVIT